MSTNHGHPDIPMSGPQPGDIVESPAGRKWRVIAVSTAATSRPTSTPPPSPSANATQEDPDE